MIPKLRSLLPVAFSLLLRVSVVAIFVAGMPIWLLPSAPALPPNVREQVWHHRNMGKAYYENPMTQIKAVDEFKAVLELAPTSTRDRVNYGLALLRAGKNQRGNY